MYILGINMVLNASAVLMKGNTIIFAIQEERLSKTKNYRGFPWLSIQACLDHAGITFQDLDAVAFSGNEDRVSKDIHFDLKKFHARYQNIQNQWFGRKPNKILRIFQDFPKRVQAVKNREEEFIYIHDFIRENGLTEKYLHYDHHLCHVASAYYGLARDKEKKYLIFTMDGGGDQKTSTVSVCRRNTIQGIAESNSFSPACLYAHITYLLGFTPHEHEYKLMGLAPYARREYAEKVRDILYRFIGFDEKDPLVFDNTSRYPGADNSKTMPKYKIIEDLYKSVLNVRFDNLAAGLQMLCEETAVRWIREGIRQTGIKRILLSGGFFMNVKANSLISQLPEVEWAGCFPSCGDESNAFGAAFLAYQELRSTDSPDIRFGDICLGPGASHDLDQAKKTYQGRVNFEEIENINEAVANLLVNKKIVARCSGRMEFGARALGNRSILASPDDVRVINKINDAIKKRDFWMPFAPAVMADKAEMAIHIPLSLKETSSPYMMFTFPAKAEMSERICAGIHQRDQTSRAQLVSPELYPEFYDLIRRFYSKTGIPAVLNTSFNLHGFPIVLGACDAIDVYLKSALDVLVVDHYLITRKPPKKGNV